MNKIKNTEVESVDNALDEIFEAPPTETKTKAGAKRNTATTTIHYTLDGDIGETSGKAFEILSGKTGLLKQSEISFRDKALSSIRKKDLIAVLYPEFGKAVKKAEVEFEKAVKDLASKTGDVETLATLTMDFITNMDKSTFVAYNKPDNKVNQATLKLYKGKIRAKAFYNLVSKDLSETETGENDEADFTEKEETNDTPEKETGKKAGKKAGKGNKKK